MVETTITEYQITGEGKKAVRFINFESQNYVERCSKFMEKVGSQIEETEAAHIFSWCIYNVFATNMEAINLMTKQESELFCREMNSDANLRLKTKKGNQITDESADYQIAKHFINNKHMIAKRTIKRAQRAYNVARQCESKNIKLVAKVLGNMFVIQDNVKKRLRLST